MQSWKLLKIVVSVVVMIKVAAVAAVVAAVAAVVAAVVVDVHQLNRSRIDSESLVPTKSTRFTPFTNIVRCIVCIIPNIIYLTRNKTHIHIINQHTYEQSDTPTKLQHSHLTRTHIDQLL